MAVPMMVCVFGNGWTRMLLYELSEFMAGLARIFTTLRLREMSSAIPFLFVKEKSGEG
jgi:hypothetical protein